MKIKLTKEQVKHIDSIRWLLLDENRAEGRTAVMAIAFIEKAIAHKGQPVKVFDHHPDGQSTRYNLMPAIGRWFEASILSKTHKMELRIGNETILFRKMTPTELKEKEDEALAISS